MHDTLTESTQAERKRLLAGGMREATIEQLAHEICALGYYLCPDDSFSYTNTGNPITYRARAISIKHSVSGKCFSNTDSPKDKLSELQAIRRNTFAFVAGRIWEL